MTDIMTSRAPKKYRDIFSKNYHGPLYKYRSAVSKFDRGKELYNQYTERIITRQSLFHQDPRKFNDPFEFAPYVIQKVYPKARGRLRSINTMKDQNNFKTI